MFTKLGHSNRINVEDIAARHTRNGRRNIPGRQLAKISDHLDAGGTQAIKEFIQLETLVSYRVKPHSCAHWDVSAFMYR